MGFLIRLVLLIFLMGSAIAQRIPLPTIDMCGAPLAIGMGKASVLDRAAKECTFTKSPVKNTDSWLLTSNGNPKEPRGIVEFEAGKLSSVKRSWAPRNNSDSDEFARALVVAMDNIIETKDKTSPSSVGTRITHDREFDFYSLAITLPTGRKVAVTLIQAASTHKTVMLDIEESIDRQ